MAASLAASSRVKARAKDFQCLPFIDDGSSETAEWEAVYLLSCSCVVGQSRRL